MAFRDLADDRREAIEEMWVELGEAVRAAGEFEEALEYDSQADMFQTAMTVAMRQMSSGMRDGYGPAALSGTAEEYFDSNFGGEGAEGQAESAARMADGLADDLVGIWRALDSANGVLKARVRELDHLADMADAARYAMSPPADIGRSF